MLIQWRCFYLAKNIKFGFLIGFPISRINTKFLRGNHDFFSSVKTKNFKNFQPVIYLNVQVGNHGTHFYGSPITPEFMDWAFNKKRGAEINKFWKKIPSNTNDIDNARTTVW